MLATVIDAEVAKTKISFLAIWTLDTWSNNSFFDYNFNKSLDLDFKLSNFTKGFSNINPNS